MPRRRLRLSLDTSDNPIESSIWEMSMLMRSSLEEIKEKDEENESSDGVDYFLEECKIDNENKIMFKNKNIRKLFDSNLEVIPEEDFHSQEVTFEPTLLNKDLDIVKFNSQPTTNSLEKELCFKTNSTEYKYLSSKYENNQSESISIIVTK